MRIVGEKRLCAKLASIFIFSSAISQVVWAIAGATQQQLLHKAKEKQK